MNRRIDFNKLISFGAQIALFGFIFSGPVAYLIVNLIKPQPEWVSSKVFVENYSTIQDLPFYFGFFLVGGMLMLVAGHYLSYKGENQKTKFHLLVALGWTIIFCALISFNYICQTTFIHNLVLNYKPEYDNAISIFSMSNPLSFCWANEMWGYGFLGIATLLLSDFYRNNSNLIRVLLVTNGFVSLISPVCTIVDVNWVMTTIGLVSYFVWNVLMIWIMIAIIKHTSKS